MLFMSQFTTKEQLNEIEYRVLTFIVYYLNIRNVKHKTNGKSSG